MRRIIAILCVCLLLAGCGTRYAEREDDSGKWFIETLHDYMKGNAESEE